MVTFRIHIDPATIENGCLNIIPGSHTQGLLSQEDLYDYTTEHTALACVAAVGSMLVMRPHLLHASRKASHPQQRRVIHVEYCSYLLPEGLSWA
jgi:ectoine hydroxylase-related dioxygenase (phytanoyl-CoA dioxygenase family)